MIMAIIETPYGKLEGTTENGVSRYFAIPYAAPPVDERRFSKPQPPLSWEGVRECKALGPNAPHKIKAFPGLEVEPLIGNGWRPGDDYLNLNIWAPEAASGAPVMVFIHGGGFVIGSNYADVQDGTAFAKSGVVIVAINYRMGIEGFLPIPGVPTNLGLRDQIAALEWVRDNIALFGGDPANVTVFGESAGGMSIANLVASPLAKGLFRRAIIESGHGNMVRDIPVAQRLVKKLAKMMSVSADEAGYRSTSVEQCMDAVEKISLPTARINLRDGDGREPVFGISRFVPVWGDDVLPQKPLDALKAGVGAEVDILIGTNAEEMNLYLVPTGVREKVGKFIAWFVLSRSQPRSRAVLKAYGLDEKGRKPGQALVDAMNDLVFRWPARRFAEEHKGRTHFYEFDWRSGAFGGELGACHGVELPFVFDTTEGMVGPEGLLGPDAPKDLAKRVHGIWSRYALDGHLAWPEFTREVRHVRQLYRDHTIDEAIMPAAPFSP